MKEIEWNEGSLDGLAALEKGTGRRVLQGIDPLEFRLRVGDFRVRFHSNDDVLHILRARNRKGAYR